MGSFQPPIPALVVPLLAPGNCTPEAAARLCQSLLSFAGTSVESRQVLAAIAHEMRAGRLSDAALARAIARAMRLAITSTEDCATLKEAVASAAKETP